LYDGDFLNQHVDFLEKKNSQVVFLFSFLTFPGSALIADQHFRKTAEKLKKRNQITTIHVAPKKKSTITKEAKAYRKSVFNARARVESPFGAIKQTFASLNKPFSEDAGQLEHPSKICIVISILLQPPSVYNSITF